MSAGFSLFTTVTSLVLFISPLSLSSITDLAMIPILQRVRMRHRESKRLIQGIRLIWDCLTWCSGASEVRLSVQKAGRS